MAKGSEFVISRTFSAPRELVWKAWTDRDMLMKWFGPKGCSLTAGKMDFRPGGTFLYGMEMNGTPLWGKWTFREIIKPEKMVTVMCFSDENGGIARHPMVPSWPRETLATSLFTEEAGKTTIHLTWEALHASPEEQATFDSMHESMRMGWGGTMDKLDEFLAQRKAA